MSSISRQDEREAGEIVVEGKSYNENRKRGVDELYTNNNSSSSNSSSKNNNSYHHRRRSSEEDPFAEYERLSRSNKKSDESRDEKRHRSSSYHNRSYHRSPSYSSSRRRYSRDYESNNNKDKRENSHVSYRGDNNNNRRSRSPVKKDSVIDTSNHRDTSNSVENKKYATTITTEDNKSQSFASIKEKEEAPAINFEIEDEEEKKKEEDRLIEERRKRRQAILNRYKASPTPSSPNTPSVVTVTSPIQMSKSLTEDKIESTPSPTGTDTNIENIDVTMENKLSESPSHQISAADYDPSMDKDLHHSRSETDLLKKKDDQEKVMDGVNSQADMLASDYTEKLEQSRTTSTITEIDMFSDNLDMFVAAADITTTTAADQNALMTNVTASTNPNLTDNWDDPEGYYSTRIGEILDGRYQILANLGRGVFSSVVKAKDQKTNEEVAIKLIRNNETMYKAGQKELTFLRKLMEADPDNKKHVIRLQRHFEHRSHLCLVFETLSMNLRDVLKKYGKDVGISIKAVRVYAQQLFLSLSLLKKCSILHADIKPDNILVSESRNTLKLCDLGSASDASDNTITPYLVSRFYRAPEIMLGLHYDYAIDVWSSACTLYELFTGKILFPGRNNNQMLKHVMEVKGRFPNKLLRKAQFTADHFDDDFNFLSRELDRVNKKEIVRKITILKPTRDIKTRILAATIPNMPDDENRLVLAFIDFLDKCLSLSPDKRMSPHEALYHPFITGKV
ncbi:MAG: kinase-like domain-containing protein [Benjaminiella poitrasii]|nr:MAG: kinase-like domain-containing protein [Benjaminiella poitrasii]